MAERATRQSAGGHDHDSPSPWIRRFASLVPAGGQVLDVACGSGRHTRLFLALGHPVTAVDVDLSRIRDLGGQPGTELIEADLEGGSWPLAGQRFAAVVVVNYLWRPLFPPLLAAIEPNGVLLYETFAEGNARFGRPANPDHLLAAEELLERVRGKLHIVAYEHGIVSTPRLAAIERLAAVKLPPSQDRLTQLPISE